MIRISKLADYAVVILSAMAKRKGEVLAAGEVASATTFPEPTVAKVLKMLAREGIVSSVRGAGGGYQLYKGAHEISIGEIIMAVDGPIALTACVDGHTDQCSFESACMVKGRWNEVNAAVLDALENVMLSDMSGNFSGHGRAEKGAIHGRI